MSEVNILNEAGEIDTVAIRESFQDYFKRDLKMSDEILKMVIEKAGKRWTDFENADDPEKEACAFLAAAEEQVAKVSITDPGITNLISRLDAEFHQAVKEDVDAVVRGKVSAVHILAHFRRLFTAEELNSLPYPGTEAEHVQGTNYRPDKVKTLDQTGKPITTVWTNDFVSAMPEGKDWEGTIDDCSKELKTVGSVPRFAGKSEFDIESIKSDATTRRNALRSMVKRALQLQHQWVAVEGMPKVGIRWIKGTNKVNGLTMPKTFGTGEWGDDAQLITGATKCICVYDLSEPTIGRTLSVTQVLSFDPSMALANGGSLADLVATAGRGRAEPEATEDAGDGEDMPDDAAQAVLSKAFNWMNRKENVALILRKAANRKADADGNDWIELICSIDQIIHPMAKKMQGAFNEIIQKELPEENAA